MADFSLPKNERIRKRSEYITTYHKGAKFETRHFRIAVMPNRLSVRRIGITVSRKVGNAVQRNRVKRRVRECFRQHKNAFPPFSDIIITAKAGAHSIPYAGVCTELASILRRAGLAAPSSNAGANNAEIASE